MTKEIKPNNNTDALYSLHLQSLSDLVANRNVFHSLSAFACLLFELQKNEVIIKKFRTSVEPRRACGMGVRGAAGTLAVLHGCGEA